MAISPTGEVIRNESCSSGAIGLGVTDTLWDAYDTVGWVGSGRVKVDLGRV
jgi:hypothetical protein